MQAALSHPNLISLAAGFTDSESLPVKHVRELFDEILASPRGARSALQYASPQGEPSLRQLTARHIALSDGRNPNDATYSPAQLLVTNGSQQLLYLVTETLCNEGDIVLVEDPTYFVYLGILQSHRVEARSVRMQPDGLDLDHLEHVLQTLKRTGDLKRVKALYLVSYFQNPTGITTTLAKKSGALDLLRRYERAAGHALYLFEDAAYRELRFQGADVPSALSVDSSRRRVIYGGTYSKPFATGTRVGFGLLPEPLFTTILRIKGNHDFGTSNLLQHLLAAALRSGRYAKHLRELQARYARKARIMAAALKKHFPAEVEWAMPKGGMYFWARLPRTIKSGRQSPLFKAALRSDVLYVPGVFCYADDPTRKKPDREMRISFGSATEHDIRTGVARLGGAVKRQKAEGRRQK